MTAATAQRVKPRCSSNCTRAKHSTLLSVAKGLKQLGNGTLRLISKLLFVSVFLIAIVVTLLQLAHTPVAHQVWINGTVLSLDNTDGVYEAISVRHGRITALGSSAVILASVGPTTRVTDLRGHTVIPGFIDAHSHFPGSGVRAITASLYPPPIGKTDSIATLLEKLRRHQQALDSPGDWLIGFGYDDSTLLEKRHPTRMELDQLSRTQPIYAWHSSGHMGVANSAALKGLGITADTSDPAGGKIVRDSNGTATGLLQENAAPELAQLLAQKSPWDLVHAARFAIHDYTKHGITTAQVGGTNATMIKLLYYASLCELVPMRLQLWANQATAGEQLLSKSLRASRYHNDKFAVGAVKIVADGSPQGRTAYLSKPYYNNQPPAAKNYRGYPTMDQASLTQVVTKYHQAGYQLAIHANGDAAIDMVIEAMTQAQRIRFRPEPRAILVHAQTARTDQLQKMKALGISPSFFPSHTYYWGDAHAQYHLGPLRAAQISPTATASNLGLRYTIHTDSPVTPINPLQLMWTAVHRQSLSGKTIGPDERITMRQALRAVTIDAAWQVFQEQKRGSLEIGKLADIVVLSANPLDKAAKLREIKVLETIVNGITVYRQN